MRNLCTLVLAVLTLTACASGGTAPPAGPAADAAAANRTAAGNGGGDGIAAYGDVITADAESDDGLFAVHRVDDEWFYEIPVDRIGEEFLMVTRVAKTPDGAGYGGSKANTSVVRWERRDDRILLRLVSYENVADEALPVYEAVRNSNFEPVIHTFDVEAFSTDSSAVVIEVTPLFTEDVALLGLPSFRRSQFGVRRVDGDRTFINYVRAFPTNVEVRRTLTYEATDPPSNGAANTVSMEMHHSMIELPDDPMEPRLCDPRVGFFSVRQVDYGLDTQKATQRCYVTRWRLEPSDPEAWARGETVDPVEPIVYYIDPATPDKWAPYLKQGVEDWQPAFEAAGFRNAIVAMDPPSPDEDPEWDPEDARYSVIRYLASDVQNASGPHVHDPRTGEILESDIQWYHNVMNLLRNWFFIQTSAVNPDARGVEFPDEVMGELVRFVSAHEVGHTIGLQHNMQSSAYYPVDSLRTRFVCEMGVAPSIMDYARFNYVAQPGDDTCLMPKVGPYDHFAIEWGYGHFAGDVDAEKDDANAFVAEMQDDPIYRFSSPTGADPYAQTEAIGDDPMRAGEFGIANLQRIVDALPEWTYQEGEDYDQLEELYNNVAGQWSRYTGHVLTVVGGVIQTRKRQGQEGLVYEPVAPEMQERAVAYLNDQVFATPTWMLNTEILGRITGSGVLDRIRGLQVSALNRLLDVSRMERLVEQEAFSGNEAYSLLEMLDDLRAGVWTEARNGSATDAYRRNLQRAYVQRMGELMEDEDALQSDVAPMARGQLTTLRRELQQAAGRTSHRATRLHYDDIVARIDAILEPGD